MNKKLIISKGGIPKASIKSFIPLEKYGIDSVSNHNVTYSLLQKYDSIFYSLGCMEDYVMFNKMFLAGLFKGKELVVGGAYTGIIKEHEKFADHFGIDYLCIGRADKFFEMHHKGELSERIYWELSPRTQYEILMDDPEYYRKRSIFSLIMDTQCRWGKCLFCHHHNSENFITPAQILKETEEKIILPGKIKHLNILDNDLDVDFAVEHIFKNKNLMTKLRSLYFFGIRCTNDLQKFEPYIREYKNIKFTLNIGIEFADQYFLDRYRKGYNLKNFMRHSPFIFDKGFAKKHPNLRICSYLLVGMPEMRKSYYNQLAEFVAEYPHMMFKGSYFLLDDGIAANFGDFHNLTILDNIKTDEFNKMGEYPGFETIYRHYLEEGMTQKDHFNSFLRPSKLLKTEGFSINHFLYPFAKSRRKCSHR